MEEKNNPSLNSVTIVVCVLYMVRHIIHIITEGIKLITPESLVYNGVELNIVNHAAATYNVVASLPFVVILAFILKKKKWAVICFFIFQIANAFSLCMIQGDFANLGVHLFVSLVCCGILSLLLLLRNKGLSGWKIIFLNSKEKTQITQPQTHIEAEYTSELCEMKEDNTHTAEHCKSETETKPVSLKKNKSKDQKQIFYGRKKYLLWGFSGFLMIALLLVLSFGYKAYNTPERRLAKADTLLKQGNIEEALHEFKRLAEQDNCLAAKTKLGILYLTNDSVPTDSIAGFKYLEDAACMDTTALKYLINLYTGKEGKVGVYYTNFSKARKYAQLALGQKRCLGVANLCLGYINIQDEKYELAYYYLTEAAKSNEPKANAFLGYLYLNGFGCDEDYQKARIYCEKELAIGEEKNALYFLGIMYKEGLGVKVNTHRAIKYLRASAKLGAEWAKEELARMEMDGTYNEETFQLWESTDK